MISLQPQQSNYVMDETGISWQSDRMYKFKQVEGFKSVTVLNNYTSCSASGLPSTCKNWYDSNTGYYYNYYYPNEQTTQYLYETYGTDLISPIAGVTDEVYVYAKLILFSFAMSFNFHYHVTHFAAFHSVDENRSIAKVSEALW